MSLSRLPQGMIAFAVLSVVTTGLGWNKSGASPAFCLAAGLMTAMWGGIALVEIRLMADTSSFGLLSTPKRARQLNAVATVWILLLTLLGAATVYNSSAWLYVSVALLVGSDVCYFGWLRIITRTLGARS
jgi:hypothetical protein